MRVATIGPVRAHLNVIKWKKKKTTQHWIELILAENLAQPGSQCPGVRARRNHGKEERSPREPNSAPHMPDNGKKWLREVKSLPNKIQL